MRPFGLVFAYSFKERLRSKAFTYMTLVMVLLAAALILVPKVFQGGKDSVDGEIAVLDTTGMVTSTDGFKGMVSKSYDWRLIKEDDLKKEEQRVKDEDGVLGLVRIDEVEGKPVLTVTVNKKDDATPYLNVLNGYVQSLYTQSEMNKLDLKPAERERLTSAVQVDVKELKAGSKSVMDTFVPIYLIIFLLYLLIYMFGGNVAVSVSVEKGSRVKEILITKVKPVHLLFGKIFGVGLAGILQFGIIIGSSYLLLRGSGSGAVIELGDFKVDFTVLDGKTLALLSVFFLLGYFFYAALFAAAGSLVSRSEEINQMVMPISMMIMGAMIFSLVVMSDPEGTAGVVGSYIPFVTPFVMFVRVGMTDPSAMEIMVPTLVLLLSTLGACWLSSKVYQVGVLLYGQKPTPKLIYRAMRSL